jgi:N-methylhydantoinase B
LERDAERVCADVRAGYVSVEAARRDYAVVVHQTARAFTLDVEATKELRERAREAV